MIRTGMVVVAVALLAAPSPARAVTLEWTRQHGSSSDDVGRGVSADGLGNVYLSGTIEGSLGGTNAGLSDVFVAKFSDPEIPEPSAASLAVLSASCGLFGRRARNRQGATSAENATA
jgi:hypothetical protein